MNGSFLRASLFTSVLSFGVAAMAKGTALEVEEDDWDRGFAVLVKALFIGAMPHAFSIARNQ